MWCWPSHIFVDLMTIVSLLRYLSINPHLQPGHFLWPYKGCSGLRTTGMTPWYGVHRPWPFGPSRTVRWRDRSQGPHPSCLLHPQLQPQFHLLLGMGTRMRHGKTDLGNPGCTASHTIYIVDLYIQIKL